MANWIKIDVMMENRADQELRDRIGADIEVDTKFNMVMIDGEKVASYSPFYQNDGEKNPNMSELVLDYGGWVVVNMPFEQLDALIRKTFVLEKITVKEHE